MGELKHFLEDLSKNIDEKERTRKIQVERAWYLIPEGEEPNRNYHSHHCVVCLQEEEECGKDECYWTYEYICYGCAQKES